MTFSVTLASVVIASAIISLAAPAIASEAPAEGAAKDAHAPAEAGHGDGAPPAPKEDEHASFSRKCFVETAEAAETPASSGEGPPQEASPPPESSGHQGQHAPATDPKTTHSTDSHEGGDAHAPAAAEGGHGDAAPHDAAEAAAPSGPLPGDALLPDPQAQEPYKLVRTLELVQDQIAIGNREAHINQRQFIAEIEKKLFDAPDAVWRKPINSRAAIIYGLSGGNPKIFDKLLRLGPLPCLDAGLLKGLLAYSQGLNQAAKSELADIEPRSLGERAGAHLALAESMLLAGDKPSRALEFLDYVRILAPGTLLEEAALRRETVVAALIEELEKFEMLTSQYMRRFGKAVYASEFVSRFAVAVASSRYANSDADFQRLAGKMDRLDPDMRRTIYSAIAQAAIVRGQVALARSGAVKLAELAKSDPALGQQAKLYEGAAMLVTDKYEDGAATLRAIDRRALNERDRPLLDAALQLAIRLRLPPQENGPVAEPPPASGDQAKVLQFDSLDGVIGNAKVAIGSADELLAGEKR
jgi:chemotaxis protein MotC